MNKLGDYDNADRQALCEEIKGLLVEFQLNVRHTPAEHNLIIRVGEVLLEYARENFNPVRPEDVYIEPDKYMAGDEWRARRRLALGE